jgi:hypothetical protein
VRRVSVDVEDQLAALRTSMAIAPDAVSRRRFTDGAARGLAARAIRRRALFPPRAVGGQSPPALYLMANGPALHLVWKEFDGDKVAVRWQVSHHSGRQWSPPHRGRDDA